MHDLMRSYIARQKRSRIHRCHWIARLNAATREYNMPYAHFINGVRTGDMMLSRRVLTTLAETEPITFKAVLDESKRYWKVRRGVLQWGSISYTRLNQVVYETFGVSDHHTRSMSFLLPSYLELLLKLMLGGLVASCMSYFLGSQ